MSFVPLPIIENGGDERLPTIDEGIESLLGKILRELKIMNIHLAAVSGEKINHSDIEG